MPLATKTQTDRRRAYRAALRDLARIAAVQRQMVQTEAAAMSEGF